MQGMFGLCLWLENDYTYNLESEVRKIYFRLSRIIDLYIDYTKDKSLLMFIYVLMLFCSEMYV